MWTSNKYSFGCKSSTVNNLRGGGMNSKFKRTVCFAAALLTATVPIGAVAKAWANKVQVEQTAEVNGRKEFIEMAEKITSSKRELKAVASLLKRYEKIGGAEGIYDGLSQAKYYGTLETAIKIFSMKKAFDCLSRYKDAPNAMSSMASYFGFWDKKTIIDLADFFSNDSVVSCITKMEKCLESKGIVNENGLSHANMMSDLVRSFITVFEDARGMEIPFAQYIGEFVEFPVEAVKIAGEASFVPCNIKRIYKISGEKATKAVLDCMLKYRQFPQETEEIIDSISPISYQGEEPVIAVAACLSKYYNTPKVAAQLAYWLGFFQPYPPDGGSFRRLSDEYLISIADAFANETVVKAILKFDTPEESDGPYGRGLVYHFGGSLLRHAIPGETIIKTAEEIMSKAKTREEEEKSIVEALEKYIKENPE